MNRAKLTMLLDGFLDLYEDVPKRNEFGARINDGDLKLVHYRIPFGEMMCRQSDLEFAEQRGFTIIRKVKIQYCNLLERKKKYKVVIDGALYDVGSFDPTPNLTYLYLEYVREVQ